MQAYSPAWPAYRGYGRPGFGYAIVGQTAPVPLTPRPPAPPPLPIRSDANANVDPQAAQADSGLLHAIPQLLVVGVVTGAAFAIGSGLVSRFIFKK